LSYVACTGAQQHDDAVELVYAITTLSVTDATPAATAGWLRGHWAIENCLHWVRDVTHAQDHSRIRVGIGPKSWPPSATPPAAVLRLHGHVNIAKALRHNARSPQQPVKLLHLTKYDFCRGPARSP
jgi:hypothetical protein